MRIRLAALTAVVALCCHSCNDRRSISGQGSDSANSVSTHRPILMHEKMPPPQEPSLDKAVYRLDTETARDEKTEEFNTEDYSPIVENNFQSPFSEPFSTFSIDVDEAAYSNVRRYLQNGTIPPGGAVRIEEMINYFDYDYAPPLDEKAFAVYTEAGPCPWNTDHQLVHIGLKGKEISMENLPASNLVFLVDVSGSMEDQNKLPLVKSSLKMLGRS